MEQQGPDRRVGQPQAGVLGDAEPVPPDQPDPLTGRARLLPLLAAGALAGCGIGGGSDQNDKRAAALECLREEKQIDARLRARNEIQIGDPRTGPRIRFYLTIGEAEAAQFSGNAEGTEHIETALLFVRGAPDDQIEEIEACLDDL